jgi:hypothetical protein
MPSLTYTQRRVFKDSGYHVWLPNGYESGYYFNTELLWNNTKHSLYLPICFEIDEFIHVLSLSQKLVFNKKTSNHIQRESNGYI